MAVRDRAEPRTQGREGLLAGRDTARNSAPLFSPQPLQQNVQALHGMASRAEWTGVKLSTLLDETGIDPKARWFIAEREDKWPLYEAVDHRRCYFCHEPSVSLAHPLHPRD